MNENEKVQMKIVPGGAITQKRPSGVMELTEEAISYLVTLTESLNELEKTISPVMEMDVSPADDESAKEPTSLEAERPDSRLRIINRERNNKINHVRRLNRSINI